MNWNAPEPYVSPEEAVVILGVSERREIETALDVHRNIVPLMLENFDLSPQGKRPLVNIFAVP